MPSITDLPLRGALTHIAGSASVAGEASAARVSVASIAGQIWAQHGPSRETRVLLEAELGYSAGVIGFVWGDPAEGNRGVYLKSGAVDAGSWARIGPLPEGDLSAIQAEIDGIWAAINLGFSLIAEWETGIAVEKYQALTDTYKVYVVLIDHTTDSIANDLLAGKIKVVFDFSLITSEALGYRDEAEGYRDEAEGFADTAASIVGSGAFQAPWTISILRSNELKINEDLEASPFDVIPANFHAGIIAGTLIDEEFHTELNTLFAEAIAAGAIVKLPQGRFIAEANGGGDNDGLIIAPPAGGSFRLTGMGRGSIIQRADSATMTDTDVLIRIVSSEGHSFEIDNITLDDNGRGTPIPPTFTDWEHSATMAYSGGSGRPHRLYCHDLRLRDRMSADHIFINTLIDKFDGHNIEATDLDTVGRGNRADISFSRVPSFITLRDCLLDRLESEAPVGAISDDALIVLENIACRMNIDWTMAANTARFFGNRLRGNTDLGATPWHYCNFGGFDGQAVIRNSFFANLAQVGNSNSDFIDTHFHVYGTVADATIAQPVNVTHGVDGLLTRFVRPTLSAAAGVVTGKYITGTVASTSLDRRVEVIDPVVLNILQYTVDANRQGTWLIEGGNPKGSVAAVKSSETFGFVNRTILRRMDEWTAPKAVDYSYGGGTHKLELSGMQDGEVCDGFMGDNASGGGSLVTWTSTRILVVDSDPNGRIHGVPGDHCVFRNDPQRLWRYGHAYAANQTVWVPVGDHPDFVLTDAGTIAVDMARSNNFVDNAVANRIIGAPTNGSPEQKGVIKFIQDAVGTRTRTFNAAWKFPGGTAPTLSTAPGAIDELEYEAVALKMVFTVTIASPAVFSATAHGLVSGVPVIFETTGALPTGLTAGTVYYVLSGGLTADAFSVSAATNSAAIITSGGQSGVHKFAPRRANRYFGRDFRAAFG